MKQRIRYSKRNVLSLLLALCMLVTMIPQMAFAADEPSDGEVVRLDIFATEPTTRGTKDPELTDNSYSVANGSTITATAWSSSGTSTVYFKAKAYDASGNEVVNADIKWSTSPTNTNIPMKEDTKYGHYIYAKGPNGYSIPVEVKATCGEVSASFTFMCEPPLTKIEWNQPEHTTYVGEESEHYLWFTPGGVYKDVVFESTDPSILPIENISIERYTAGTSKGYKVKYKTLKAGEFNLTAKVKDNPNLEPTTCHIKVNNQWYDPDTLIYLGQETELEYKIYPQSLDQSLRWESSDPSVVSVDNGLITGLKLTEEPITITGTSVADPSIVFSWKIRVWKSGIKLEENLDAKDVSAEEEWNVIENEKTIRLFYYQGESFLTKPDWYSSNTDIATIVSIPYEDNGTVTFKKDGYVTFIAKVNDKQVGKVTFSVSGFDNQSNPDEGWEPVNEGQGQSSFSNVQLSNCNVETQTFNDVWFENKISEPVKASNCSFDILIKGSGKSENPYTEKEIAEYENNTLPKINIYILKEDGTLGSIAASYKNGYELVKSSYDREGSTTILLSLKVNPDVLKRGSDYVLVIDKNVSAGNTTAARIGKEAQYKFTTVQAANKVNLSESAATVKIGESLAIKADISGDNPEVAPDDVIIWNSSDESVASVDSNGKVIAKKAGTAIITATAKYGKVKAQCKVTVPPIKVTKVAVNASKATITVGSTKSLKATVYPSNASNKAVIWKSSNSKIAKVSSTGKVTAVKPGKATITVTTKDGSFKAKTVINVIPKTTIFKLYAKKHSIAIKYKKIKGVSGYQVYRASSKNGTYKKVTTRPQKYPDTYTSIRLTSGKTYYYKIRTYKTVNGKRIYSKFSEVKKIRTKK